MTKTEGRLLTAALSVAVSILVTSAFVMIYNHKQTKTMLDLYNKKIEISRTMVKEQTRALCSSYHRWTELAKDHIESMDRYCEQYSKWD